MKHYTVCVYTKYTEDLVESQRFSTYTEASDFVSTCISTGSNYCIISLE